MDFREKSKGRIARQLEISESLPFTLKFITESFENKKRLRESFEFREEDTIFSDTFDTSAFMMYIKITLAAVCSADRSLLHSGKSNN